MTYNSKKFLKFFLPPIVKGLLFSGVFGLALYAYAAYIQPPPEPHPATGVVGQFVGLSKEIYETEADYVHINNYCKIEDVIDPSTGQPYPSSDGTTSKLGAHVCTAMELINSYNIGNAAILEQAGDAWFNNGPPAHLDTLVNDCQGWSSTDDSVLGTLWKFDAKKGLIMYCDENTYSFACCK